MFYDRDYLIDDIATGFDNSHDIYTLLGWLQRAVKKNAIDVNKLTTLNDDFLNQLREFFPEFISDMFQNYIKSEELRALLTELIKSLINNEELKNKIAELESLIEQLKNKLNEQKDVQEMFISPTYKKLNIPLSDKVEFADVGEPFKSNALEYAEIETETKHYFWLRFNIANLKLKQTGDTSLGSIHESVFEQSVPPYVCKQIKALGFSDVVTHVNENGFIKLILHYKQALNAYEVYVTNFSGNNPSGTLNPSGITQNRVFVENKG